MIETLLTLVKNVLALLPFVLLCLAGSKVNLSKSERSRQVLMPVLALVYVIAAMLLLNNINEWILALLDNIPKWIASLAAVDKDRPTLEPLVIEQLEVELKSGSEEAATHFANALAAKYNLSREPKSKFARAAALAE